METMDEVVYVTLTGEHRIFGCYLMRDPSSGKVTIRPTAPSKDLLTYEFCHVIPIRAYQDTHGNESTHVMVYMNSFFYLGGKGEETFLEPSSAQNDLISRYFTEHIHQLGYHIYCSRYGTLSSILLSQNTMGGIRGSALAGIIAVYPAIADYFTMQYKPREPHLVLGLHFQYYWDYYDRSGNRTSLDRKHYEESKGYRFFHRGQAKTKPTRGKGLKYFPFETEPLTVGKVWDITEKHLQEINTKSALGDIRDTKGPKEIYVKRVAVYVCAGARLLLVDENHQLFSNTEHNRSVIEPGGLVVVDGTEFNIGWPQLDEYGVPISMDWKAFIRKMVTDPAKLAAFGLDQIHNPVIFLGAVESQFNSIAYELSVKRNFNYTETLSEEFSHNTREYLRVRRTTSLLPPEGSAILAVEDWDTTGLQEIMARHRYEQLHRGVTFLRDRNNRSYQEEGNRHFIAPEGQMLVNIAGKPFTRTTRVECDFTEDFRQRDPEFSRDPPRVEFNFSRTTLDAVGRKHMTAEDSNRHLPSAPAYPPVLLNDKLYYLPQTLFKASEMYDIFHVFKVYKGLDLEAMDRTEESVMKLKIKDTKRFDEYYWEKDPTHPIKEPNVWVYPEFDNKTKLGVDGHWYEKTNQKIGTVYTRYYEVVSTTKSSKPLTPAVPQESSTPKRPSSGKEGESKRSRTDDPSSQREESAVPAAPTLYSSSSSSSSGSPEESRGWVSPESSFPQQPGSSDEMLGEASGTQKVDHKWEKDKENTQKEKGPFPLAHPKFSSSSSSSSSESPEKSRAWNLPEGGSPEQSGSPQPSGPSGVVPSSRWDRGSSDSSSDVDPPVVDVPKSSAPAVPPKSRQPPDSDRKSGKTRKKSRSPRPQSKRSRK